MTMTTASRDYFAQVAGQWDELRAGYFQEPVRQAAIAKAYLRPEMVVADVGTGTGFMAAGLAPLVSQVYALDGSPAMIEVAQRNLAGHDNVTFRVADGDALALDDASVDAVFANMVLHHCPDPAAAIREMVCALRPGGRLVITDLDQHDHIWMREEMADAWLGFAREQVKAWLRAAGLVNIIVDCTSQSCCATSTADASAQAEVSVFVATGSRSVTGTREAVRANYAAVATSAGCGCSADAPAAGSPTIEAVQGSCCDSAPASSSACCLPNNAMIQIEAIGGDAGLSWITAYSPEQLAAVPAEAAALSLGCGNPTAMAALRLGQVVLDIGSGAGIDAFYAARRVGPTGKVIGLDMTPAMIARARQSAEQAGLSQVEFRLGHAEEMPVEENSVDVVLSNCVINLCQDKGKVFEEAYRILKVGGRLSISDVVSDQPLPMSWRSDAARWAGCVHGALPEGEYLDLVKQAGFVDIQAQRTLSGGTIEGVQVYSLSVVARKE